MALVDEFSNKHKTAWENVRAQVYAVPIYVTIKPTHEHVHEHTNTHTHTHTHKRETRETHLLGTGRVQSCSDI